MTDGDGDDGLGRYGSSGFLVCKVAHPAQHTLSIQLITMWYSPSELSSSLSLSLSLDEEEELSSSLALSDELLSDDDSEASSATATIKPGLAGGASSSEDDSEDSEEESEESEDSDEVSTAIAMSQTLSYVAPLLCECSKPLST